MKPGGKRPRTILLVFWGLTLLGLWEAGKVVALTEQFRLLLELGVQPDPRLRLVISAGWMALLLGTAVALWNRRVFTRWLVPGVLSLYVLYQLALTAVYVRAPVNALHWLPDVLLATAVILYSAWALNRETATSYFVEEGQADSLG